MLVIPGQPGKDLCDRGLGVTRRDLLRVGGSAVLGLTLGGLLSQQAAASETPVVGSGPGWGKAKSIIMVYLQGGPSHLDLWDPKENVPDNVRSVFKPIADQGPRHPVHRDAAEVRPGHRQVHAHPLDELHAQRPVQPHGRHLPDDDRLHDRQGQPVGPARAASPKDFPNFGSNIIRLKPPTVPMLPFVMMPRPLQESNVVGKGGTAGFLGRAYDPYTLYPPGDDMDMTKMDRIKVDDLQLRPEVSASGSSAGPSCAQLIDAGMPDIERATAKYKLDVLRQGAGPDRLGPGPRCVRSEERARRDARPVRPQHVRPELPAGPPAGRGRHPRRRGHLAQGGQLRQPLVGHPRRSDQADEEPVGADARRRSCRP